jgi:NAD+ synthase (glutamine-hydrolysing)
MDRMGWDRKNIIAGTLPGPGTTAGTHKVAVELPRVMGTSFFEAPIEDIATGILRAIGHEPCWNCLTCENVQARVRTNIGMAAGFLLGTGDMSEAFKGFCTYGGDQISMYNSNASIPKTMVSFLIKQVADDNVFGDEVSAIIRGALELEISPELIKVTGDQIVQVTEEIIGPYLLTDFFMRAIVRDGFEPKKVFWLGVKAFNGMFDPATVMKWLKDSYKRFFASQFKRQAMPDGAKVGMSLDPRNDFRMCSDIAMPESIITQFDEICGMLGMAV